MDKKYYKWSLWAVFWVSISCWGALSYAANVDSVRLWRAPDHTRLVFDLSGPANHSVFTLNNPNRLVIDIESSTMMASLDKLNLMNTPVTKLRHGSRTDGNLRVVLDLSKGIKPRSFTLRSHAGKPDRLVIDLHDSGQATVKTFDAIKSTQKPQRDIIVAIDAGHGGEDPGAIGPRKVQEKDVVMKLSRELERLINAEPGYTAKLTRTGDYYIPLHKRRNKARELRADLFISIHADAFKNPAAKGASVFTLSRKGATSESARFLASKENEADLIGGAGDLKLMDMQADLAEVIVDLSMTATLADSLDVGSRVLAEIGQVTRLHKKHVEQAGFLVLKSPDVPSILVEVGFISNPEEARKLSTHSHRRTLANAIFGGVKSYFYSEPPDGTWVSAQLKRGGNIQYTILSGDTLSGIAEKYSTSVGRIKKINSLKGNSIRVGQKISIPTS